MGCPRADRRHAPASAWTWASTYGGDLDGRLLGATLKPKFNALYSKVGSRAGKQAATRLQGQLSSAGWARTEAHWHGQDDGRRVLERVRRAHPGSVFVIEDLDLRGCRGSQAVRLPGPAPLPHYQDCLARSSTQPTARKRAPHAATSREAIGRGLSFTAAPAAEKVMRMR